MAFDKSVLTTNLKKKVLLIEAGSNLSFGVLINDSPPEILFPRSDTGEKIKSSAELEPRKIAGIEENPNRAYLTIYVPSGACKRKPYGGNQLEASRLLARAGVRL